MNDFEVHPIGTAREIKLYRELIFQMQEDVSQIVLTSEIVKKLNKLIAHYDHELNKEGV